jgi:hypothetical protein
VCSRLQVRGRVRGRVRGGRALLQAEYAWSTSSSSMA